MSKTLLFSLLLLVTTTTLSSTEAPEPVSPPLGKDPSTTPFVLLHILAAILFFRLAPRFLLPLLTSLISLVIARKTKPEVACEAELTTLRVELRAFHMVDQFALYAKTERKIKKAEQVVSAARSKRKTRLAFLQIGLRILLRLVEGIVMAWITWTSRWEAVHILPHYWLDVLPEAFRYEALVSPPGLFFLPLWISLCHFTIHRISPLFRRTE